MVEGRRAAIAASQRREQLEERAAQRARLAHDRSPAVVLYRREKKRYQRETVAPAIRAAKLEMARIDERNALARRGGRPKKVRNG
jgi:hypothetical protein